VNKVEDIFTQNKKSISENKNLKVLSTLPRIKLCKTAGARISYSRDDTRTGRRLAFINYFGCRDTNVYIIEVILPEAKYRDFMKNEKKFVMKVVYF